MRMDLAETIKDSTKNIAHMISAIVKMFFAQNDLRLENNRSEEIVIKRVEDRAAETTRMLADLQAEIEESKTIVGKLKKITETTSKESNC